MVSDRAYFICVFLEVKPFCDTKVMAISQGKGQISRSHLPQKKKVLTLAVTFE